MFDVSKPVFDNWKVEKEIGSGAYGKVYVISKNDNGKKVYSALKVIQIPKDQSELSSISEALSEKQSLTSFLDDFVKNFSKEIEVMIQLKGHPNIVGYEDHRIIIESDGISRTILIRMELLNPLNKYQSVMDLTLKDIAKIGIDICESLSACHSKNIIHRDVKPENIFVQTGGTYKLGDFGIARELEKTTGGLSQKGSPSYMAPEVSAGKRYNKTVDIYSIGIVLYKLLNHNRTPFLPPYPKDVFFNDIENARITRLSGTPIPPIKGIPDDFNRIVLKATAFNPADRYQTAAEMKADLTALYRRFPEKPLAQTVKKDETKKSTAVIEKGVETPEDSDISNEETISATDFDEGKTKRAKPEPAPEKKENEETTTESTKEKKPKKISKVYLIPGIAILTALCVVFGIILVNYVLKPENKYKEALQLFNDGNYSEAIVLFEELHNYKDSEEKLKEIYVAQADELIKNGKYEEAVSVLQNIDSDDAREKIKECNYHIAINHYNNGEYEAALSLFEELEDYSDSKAYITDCKYKVALELYNAKNYSKAAEYFEALGDYSESKRYLNDCRYALGTEAYNNGDYKGALSLFEALGDYVDSKKYVKYCNYQISDNEKANVKSCYSDIPDDLKLPISFNDLQMKLGFSDDDFENELISAYNSKQIEVNVGGSTIIVTCTNNSSENVYVTDSIVTRIKNNCVTVSDNQSGKNAKIKIIENTFSDVQNSGVTLETNLNESIASGETKKIEAKLDNKVFYLIAKNYQPEAITLGECSVFDVEVPESSSDLSASYFKGNRLRTGMSLEKAKSLLSEYGANLESDNGAYIVFNMDNTIFELLYTEVNGTAIIVDITIYEKAF